MAKRGTHEATRGFAPNLSAEQHRRPHQPAVGTSCTKTQSAWFLAAVALVSTLTCTAALEGLQVQVSLGSNTPAAGLTSPQEDTPRVVPNGPLEANQGSEPTVVTSDKNLEVALKSAATVKPEVALGGAARTAAPAAGASHKQPPKVAVLLRRVNASGSVAASSALASQQISHQKVCT